MADCDCEIELDDDEINDVCLAEQGPPGKDGVDGNQGDQGDIGPQGNAGWAPIIQVATDGTRRVLQISDWAGGQGTKPGNIGMYLGPTSLVSDIALAVDIRGIQGLTGQQGFRGSPGGEAQLYTYSTTTSDADPGTGTIRFNNANLALATQAFIDLQNAAGADVSAWVDSIDDSTSAMKAVLRVSRTDNNSMHNAFFYITSITTASGYRKLNLVYIGGVGTLDTTLSNVIVSINRTGDKGEQGVQGPALVNGVISDPSLISGSVQISKIIALTTAQYSAIVTKDPNTLYVITDA